MYGLIEKGDDCEEWELADASLMGRWARRTMMAVEEWSKGPSWCRLRQECEGLSSMQEATPHMYAQKSLGWCCRALLVPLSGWLMMAVWRDDGVAAPAWDGELQR